MNDGRSCTRRVVLRAATLVVGAVSCGSADAHEMLLRYNLPIPFRLYVYGCVGALLVTFALLAWFLRRPLFAGAGPGSPALRNGPSSRSGVLGNTGARREWPMPTALVTTIRVLALGALVATIGTGLFGPKDPDTNLSETIFWDLFLLGFTYATALVGDVFSFASPWLWLARLVDTDATRVRRTYPERLGYWPALILYLGVAWLELFVQPNPGTLAWLFIGYTVLMLAGSRLFGAGAWLGHAEAFGVFFRLVGLMAPIAYRLDSGGDVTAVRRPWFSALLDEEPDRLSLVLFVLALLSSTTYDGMHQTVLWMGLYWNELLPALQPQWASDLRSTQATWEHWYALYQRVGLLLAPLLYLSVYLLVLAAARRLTGSTVSLRRLALAFAYSILPIAIAYNVAHYYTLVLTKAPDIPWLFEHAFGFGTPTSGDPPVLDMAQVWHVEVGLILLGHVVSVIVAHRVALNLFGTPRQVVASQLPMLLLMMAYTVVGLWVISLPFTLT